MPTLLVLPKPSRFDKANDDILVGPARSLVDETLGANRYDICYASQYKERLASGLYTHILLTGQESLDQWLHGADLSSQRGFVWHLPNHVKLVATFWPQDCCDLKDYESHEDENDKDQTNGKDSAPTQRANYRFWFKRDCAKLFNTPEPLVLDPFKQVSCLDAAQLLNDHRTPEHLFIDIESHPPSNSLTCLSFAFGAAPVHTVLIYDYAGRLATGAHEFISALARAFKRHKLIIHNCGFDLLFLALYHGIPFGANVEDTMLIGHRLFPEAEKSLAHAITLWLNAPYHKDQGGTWDPRTWDQQDRLLRYNSKDVSTLRAVYNAQRRYIDESGDPGLAASVAQVNQSIFPYLYTSLHGLPVNGLRLLDYRRRREFAAQQWLRVVKTLCGFDLNPDSPQQMGAYFVDGLKYHVTSRTESGAPRVDEGALYKYLIAYSNPIIKVLLKWKRAKKTAAELGFQFYQQQKGRQ